MAELDAEIAALRQRLERLTIRAPAAGVVLTEHLDRRQGEHVSAGALLLEIGDPRQWRVRLHVRGYDVHQVHAGQRVLVEIDALSVEEHVLFDGRVAFVAADPVPEHEGSSRHGSYRILVDLRRDPTEQLYRTTFRRGYAAQGRIITEAGTLFQIALRRLRTPAS